MASPSCGSNLALQGHFSHGVQLTHEPAFTLRRPKRDLAFPAVFILGLPVVALKEQESFPPHSLYHALPLVYCSPYTLNRRIVCPFYSVGGLGPASVAPGWTQATPCDTFNSAGLATKCVTEEGWQLHAALAEEGEGDKERRRGGEEEEGRKRTL